MHGNATGILYPISFLVSQCWRYDRRAEGQGMRRARAVKSTGLWDTLFAPRQTTEMEIASSRSFYYDNVIQFGGLIRSR
jgi:hypothetical protein